MSVFQLQVSQALPIQKKITASTVTVIVDASSAGDDAPVVVPWFEVNENAGATPNLTVDIYDGTNTFYPGSDGATTTWRAKAVTANQTIKFTAGYIIQRGSQLRVTSNDAAGKFDVIGIRKAKQS